MFSRPQDLRAPNAGYLPFHDSASHTPSPIGLGPSEQPDVTIVIEVGVGVGGTVRRTKAVVAIGPHLQHRTIQNTRFRGRRVRISNVWMMDLGSSIANYYRGTIAPSLHMHPSLLRFRVCAPMLMLMPMLKRSNAEPNRTKQKRTITKQSNRFESLQSTSLMKLHSIKPCPNPNPNQQTKNKGQRTKAPTPKPNPISDSLSRATVIHQTSTKNWHSDGS